MSEAMLTLPRLVLPLLILLLPVAGLAAAAEPSLPHHRLAISFTMEDQVLHGTSQIDLPPDTPAKVLLGDLTVDRILLNNRPISLSPENGPELPIEALAVPQQLTIRYRKRFTVGQRADGLISQEGITLLDLWHPLLEQKAIFELAATIPDRFEAVSEADEILRADSPEGKRLLFRFPQPVYSIHFAAGPYVVEKVLFGQGQELYTYFFPEDRELAANYRTKTLGYLKRYQREVGPFPYRRFSVVENRLPTGYALPTFTLLGQVVVRLPFITETSLGHEVLHQWFGNAVEVEPGRGNWAEGLTTYLADQAFAEEEDKGAAFRKDQLIKYESYIHEENASPLVEFKGVSGHQEAREEDQRAIGYAKGSMVFHMLERRLGKEVFQHGLQDFYQRLKFRSATWQDLKESFSLEGGQDLTSFFNQWLTRPSIPALAVRKLRIDTADGRMVLAFDLDQSSESPYDLEVPMIVETDEGRSRYLISTAEMTKEVELQVPALPRELVIDPDYDLMRHLTLAELPPVWSRFAGAPRKLAVMAEEDEERFRPLLEALADYELPVKSPGEVTEDELAAASVLFLGTATEQVRSLFASPRYPETGFTVDVRANPLNPEEVGVIVTSAGPGQTAKAAGKLQHYGKYSYLHFLDGRIQKKNIAESARGQRYPVLEPPRGVATAKTLAFEEIARRLLEERVIYVGETHTSYADHLLQLRVLQALYQRNPNLAIGMEMFSRPAQEVLDAYIAGDIDEWAFLKESHYFKTWGFDYRLYRDIIDFARNHRIPIIALNLEKEIVNKVFKEGGVSGLSPAEREKLPPERALGLPGYWERLAAVFAMHGPGSAGGPPPDQIKGFVQAQALWDETMAQTVAAYLQEHPEGRMLVLAGRGHVTKENGIPPRVERRLPVKQAVVVNSDGRGVEPGRSDYVLFSPEVALPPPVQLGVMLAEEDGLLTIKGFAPHGKAKPAGLEEGDILLAVDGEPVRSVEDLKIALLYKEGGKPVRVRILRPRGLLPDKQMEIEVPM